MISKRRREQAPFPLLGTRIRGRLRGFETVWTLDRFTEVIRNEVSKGIDRAWPPDRIRSRIRTAYELDPRSLPYAAQAVDTVLGILRFDKKPQPHGHQAPPAAPDRQPTRDSPRSRRSTAGLPVS